MVSNDGNSNDKNESHSYAPGKDRVEPSGVSEGEDGFICSCGGWACGYS